MAESPLQHRPADSEPRHDPREAARGSTIPRSGELERPGPGRYVLVAGVALVTIIAIYILAWVLM